MELTRNDRKRVVITGLGVVSPLGAKWEFWDAIQQGKIGDSQAAEYRGGPSRCENRCGSSRFRFIRIHSPQTSPPHGPGDAIRDPCRR